MRTCLVVAAAVVCGCAHPRPAPPPLAPPEARVARAMAAWGEALRAGDAATIAQAEDGDGRLALAYVGAKTAASHVDGGAEAVEMTVFGTVLAAMLSSWWPGMFGDVANTVVLAVPPGSLAPALAAAGLLERPPPGAPAMVYVAVPWDQTVGRVREASQRHRAELRARAAWTCRPTAIERTILSSEPSLQRGAALSQHIFASWLAHVDAAWLVRADCAGRPGAFIVTGHVVDGVAHDRVLVAAVTP
jgi:hypothetical protein